MINIIKRGVAPAERAFELACFTCHTVFTFLASDAKLTYDQRDGNFYSINCPVCYRALTAEENSYVKPRRTEY